MHAIPMKAVTRSTENTRAPMFLFIVVFLQPFPGGRRGARLSTQNAYVPFASGLAGLYHPGVNRGWGDPTNFCRRIIEAPPQGHGRKFIYKFCPIPLHVLGLLPKLPKTNPPPEVKTQEIILLATVCATVSGWQPSRDAMRNRIREKFRYSI